MSTIKDACTIRHVTRRGRQSPRARSPARLIYALVFLSLNVLVEGETIETPKEFFFDGMKKILANLTRFDFSMVQYQN